MQSKLLLIAGALGIVCGVISNYGVFVGSWMNLLFWGIAGMIVGLFVRQQKEILWAGVVYGVFLTLSFLLYGFRGNASQFFGFLVFVVVLCVPGVLGGFISVYLGNKLKHYYLKNLRKRGY